MEDIQILCRSEYQPGLAAPFWQTLCNVQRQRRIFQVLQVRLVEQIYVILRALADESRLTIDPTRVEILTGCCVKNVTGEIIKRRQLVGLQHRLQLHWVSNFDVGKGAA